MSHQPYPNAHKARAQIARHHDDTIPSLPFATLMNMGLSSVWPQLRAMELLFNSDNGHPE